jgi:hypothetical protein
MSFISTTVYGTVTLGSAAYPSPLIIEPSGAVYGRSFGAIGVESSTSGVSLTNLGHIAAYQGMFAVGSAGVVLAAGGSVTNGGSITGGYGGGFAGGHAGGAGVSLNGGVLNNGGTITGGRGGYGSVGGTGGAGVDLTAATILTNMGTITGGAAGQGAVSGGYSGVGVYMTGGTLTNAGTIAGGAGGLAKGEFATVSVEITGNATVTLEPGAIFTGQVVGDASADDILQLTGTQSGGTPIDMGEVFRNFSQVTFGTGAKWTVVYQNLPAPATGFSINNMGVGATFEFNNLNLATVTADQSGDTFTTPEGTFTFVNPGGTLVLTSADGFAGPGSGTDVTVEAPCYCRGTRIGTASGETAIEDLAIGEMVRTASGALRPVVWLGHRRLDTRGYADPTIVWPVRIQAGAFAQNEPARDLWVSPGHAIFVDGMLIPANRLVNGTTITQVALDRVEYWHVELASHDLLLAEGLAAESYLDDGNRTGFENGGAFIQAHPDFAPKHWGQKCMPLVLEGEGLHRAKAALLSRAQELGCALTEDPDLHVLADGQRIEPVALGVWRIAFVLPEQREKIELRSRTFVAAHTKAANTDPRVLGICVGRLQIDGSELALDDEAAFAQGWHRREPQGDGRDWRWTRGGVPLPAGSRLVVLDLAGRGCYWQQPQRDVVARFG